MMKYFKSLVVATVVLASTAATANPYNYRIIRVIDGDTVEFDAPFLPVELKQVLKLRIEGVDTPEKGRLAKCDRERMLAERATQFTQRTIAGAIKHQVVITGWDKYGGRVLGDVILNDNISLKRLLLEARYAMPYDGGKKVSWC
jgi:endonuclease YncB( thermonuclease family)